MSDICWCWMVELQSGNQYPVENPIGDALIPQNEFERLAIAYWDCGP